MVKKIREIELAIGKVTYNISKSSKKNLNSRRSIYVSKQINKGAPSLIGIKSFPSLSV